MTYFVFGSIDYKTKLSYPLCDLKLLSILSQITIFTHKIISRLSLTLSSYKGIYWEFFIWLIMGSILSSEMEEISKVKNMGEIYDIDHENSKKLKERRIFKISGKLMLL